MITKSKGDFMALVKVKNNYQITIPSNLRKKFNLVVGDYVEIEKHQSEIVIKPVKVVHPDQEYFYTKEWQKDEADADKDIAANRMAGPFETADDLIKELES